MTSEPSLVNRRSAQTRRDIIDAAMALFEERGFDDVPMAAVAEAAGVARRTLYRYFPTKEEIVFESPREWLAVFESVVAERAADESTREVMRRAILAVTEYVESQRDRVTREFAILLSSPTLLARRGRSDGEWIERYAELLAQDVDGGPAGQLEALVCAMSLVAMQNALMVVWASTPDARAPDLAVAALDQLDGTWPAGARTV